MNPNNVYSFTPIYAYSVWGFSRIKKNHNFTATTHDTYSCLRINHVVETNIYNTRLYEMRDARKYWPCIAKPYLGPWGPKFRLWFLYNVLAIRESPRWWSGGAVGGGWFALSSRQPQVIVPETYRAIIPFRVVGVVCATRERLLWNYICTLPLGL